METNKVIKVYVDTNKNALKAKAMVRAFLEGQRILPVYTAMRLAQIDYEASKVMGDLYRIYVGKPTYKRVLLRRVSWWLCHWRNVKFHFRPNFKSHHFWFWNIQLLLIGSSKCNGSIKFRFLNWELEIGW